MRICGLQKLAMVDFPGKVAATVFTGGCNLRCPFCHNAPLVTRLEEAERWEETDAKITSLTNRLSRRIYRFVDGFQRWWRQFKFWQFL